MLKKCTSVLMLVCMIVSILTGTFLTASAVDEAGATENTATEEKATKDNGFFLNKANLHIEANKKAGLEGNVTVEISKVTLSGTLYLPGSANTENLFFSWDDEDLVVSKDDVTYESGKAPVAAAGESISYNVSNGKTSAVITVKTIKGSTGVAGMFLNLDEDKGTIADMNADPDHETSCYGSVNFDGMKTEYISMKGRGNSTWGFDKRPYNVTFYKKSDYDKKKSVSLINGVESKKWSLLANYLDNSLMRNKVGLDLAKSLGIGLDSRFVDVWMNGEYLGNYLLTPKNDYQAPDGGYALENDNYLSTDDPNAEEDYQFKMDGMQEIGALLNIDGYYSRITVKDIGDDAIDAGVTNKSIEEWYSKAWAAVEDYDSEEYQKYFDIDSWTKMYLMYEVAKTYDAFSGSILMHRDGLTDNDALIAGPTWDMDTCFGRTMYKFLVGIALPNQLNAEGWYIDSIGLTASSKPVSLLQELGKHPSFLQRMSEVYNDYTWAFDSIYPNIEAQRSLISDSADMNNDLWGLHHLGTYFVPVPLTIGMGKYQLHYEVTKDWDAYVSNFGEFATKRVAYLTDHLYAEAPVGEITSASADKTITLTANVTSGNKANTFQWQNSTDGETWNNVEGATEATYSFEITAEQNNMQYRCVVKNAGSNIVTIHTGIVKSSAQTILNPVKITVNLDALEETNKDIDVPAPTEPTDETTTNTETEEPTTEETTEEVTEPIDESFSRPTTANQVVGLLTRLGNRIFGSLNK